MENQKTIEELFNLYKKGLCSREEVDSLIRFFSLPENESKIRELIQSDFDDPNNTLKEVSDEDILILETSLQKIRQVLGMENQRPKRNLIRFPNYLKIAVAAVLFLLASLTSIYIINQKSATNQTKTAFKKPILYHDVAPGREGAILTMANGKQIVLDTASNRSLKEKGKVLITKKDGQLVYTSNVPSTLTAPILYNTLSTPNGRTYKIILSDGTQAWLNAASSIKFPTIFGSTERSVEVTGEVYFEVAHDPSKPFIVQNKDFVVEVLGTHFNINSYDNEDTKKVTLLEGIVKVAQSSNKQSLRLLPGQQAQISTEIKVINDIDPEEVLAWKNGKFIFRNADLKQIMRAAARWYDIEVSFAGSVSDEKYIGEVSRNTSLREMMKILEFNGVKYQIQENKIIVTQ